jgi:hypothetical protein
MRVEGGKKGMLILKEGIEGAAERERRLGDRKAAFRVQPSEQANQLRYMA